MKILFVCTGNTCRSPMAQIMAQGLFGDGYEVFSAGLMAMPNAAASAHAVTAMHERKFDLSKHRAQLVTETLLESASLILAMTEGHKEALVNAAPDKVYTLGEYASCGTSISDPYGGDLMVYQKCAEEIFELLLKINDRI